jgi:hypothetical protein
MANGYTLAGVAGRIREVEHKIGGGWYVSVCWLAMARDSGKGAKKRLEDKVFGIDKPKVTSTFRNAWRIAERSFAEGFHAECRKAVAELGLDDAISFAINRLDQHKAALKVTNMADYEDVCKYASVDVIPVAEDDPETAPPEASAKKSGLGQPSPMETAIEAMHALSAGELIEFTAKVDARLMELQQGEHLRIAA